MDSELFRVVSIHSEEILIEMIIDLRMENAPIFYEDFKNLYKDKDASIKKLILDFTSIRFIDSSGLGILIKCSKEITKNGGEILIFGMKRSLYSVFKLAGLLKIFHVVHKEDLERDSPHLFD